MSKPKSWFWDVRGTSGQHIHSGPAPSAASTARQLDHKQLEQSAQNRERRRKVTLQQEQE
jgi:hypothetical protein